MRLHADTHVAVWLRLGDTRRLKPVRRLLDDHPLLLSPYAVLELQSLYEIGRLREPARWLVDHLAEDWGLRVDREALPAASERALDLSFTRDPFDRLIAAHALAAGATLLTADQHLLRHLSCATWG